MKYAALILISFLAASTKAWSQSLEKVTSISFTKQSRGYIDEVIISRDSVQGFVENHRVPGDSRQYASEVGQDEWAKLLLALQDVPLENIDGLQSPTTNRAHDGALHSSIVITFENGSVVSHSFDDEKPHPDLKPLLDAILHFRLAPAR